LWDVWATGVRERDIGGLEIWLGKKKERLDHEVYDWTTCKQVDHVEEGHEESRLTGVSAASVHDQCGRCVD